MTASDSDTATGVDTGPEPELGAERGAGSRIRVSEMAPRDIAEAEPIECESIDPHDQPNQATLETARPRRASALQGQLLDGRYELRDQIGVGGMGFVYRAHQIGVGRDVAVKVLNPSIARGDDHVAALFFREARAVSRLRHPNIITLHDFGRSADGLLYIAMELLDGEALSDRLSRGPLPIPMALHIAAQVADALAEAHAEGVVHRDIKPDNIIIENQRWDSQFAKVLDFGVAKVVDSSFQLGDTGIRFGTPLYMCPEQILGDSMEPASDLYTLGVLLFEMLTGSPPYVGRSAVEICRQHLDNPVPRLAEWDSPRGFPEDLTELVRSLMAKEPRERPKSAAVVRDQLLSLEEREERSGPTRVTVIRRGSNLRKQTAAEAAAVKEMRGSRPFTVTDALATSTTSEAARNRSKRSARRRPYNGPDQRPRTGPVETPIRQHSRTDDVIRAVGAHLVEASRRRTQLLPIDARIRGAARAASSRAGLDTAWRHASAAARDWSNPSWAGAQFAPAGAASNAYGSGWHPSPIAPRRPYGSPPTHGRSSLIRLADRAEPAARAFLAALAGSAIGWMLYFSFF